MITIPRIIFAHLPTPVEYLPRLSTYLGGPKLYIKRDDQTGLGGGGNKTRKLEFLIAAAVESGGRTLVTAGAAQSNHCRQTAAAAARFGLECILVLVGNQPSTFTGNLLLDRLFGSEIVWTDGNPRDECLQQVVEQAKIDNRNPYLIPYGGSNPVGAVGYVYAIRELVQQWQSSTSLVSIPDWIIFASSSGGTHAGLVAGAKIFGYKGKLLGISIDEPAGVLQKRVAVLATDTLNKLGKDLSISDDMVLVNDNFLGGGYGIAGEQEIEAISIFARLEGILLDPVYTGRAAAGLINLIESGQIKQNESVLFWHTGGSQALFADRYSGLWD